MFLNDNHLQEKEPLQSSSPYYAAFSETKTPMKYVHQIPDDRLFVTSTSAGKAQKNIDAAVCESEQDENKLQENEHKNQITLAEEHQNEKVGGSVSIMLPQAVQEDVKAIVSVSKSKTSECSEEEKAFILVEAGEYRHVEAQNYETNAKDMQSTPKVKEKNLTDANEQNVVRSALASVPASDPAHLTNET